MNQQSPCDPTSLSSFLRGELSAEDELNLTEHLDYCEQCGKALEHQVAEASLWREARDFLSDSDFQFHDTSTLGCGSNNAPIEQVLSLLSPSDDPVSLGRIGSYEVTGVIGVGGMGVVLKAHEHSLDRVVAVKVMATHLASSGTARQRFAREAKAAAAVLHPNVIAIHAVASHQGLPYLVMPYVKGETLKKRVDTDGPLPMVDILRIGMQIAAGLAAAHEQGLVHRDIKPSNILLEEGVERVTITDFGLARAVDDASMTRSGLAAGTPQYMSPEQARGESIDQRSDLFSLGSVLYTLATGRPPFRSDSSLAVMRKITDEHSTPIRELNPEIPEWLCAIIRRLMAKERDARFASAEEVHELFEAFLSHAQQPTVHRLPQVPEPRPRQSVSTFLQIFTGVFAVLTITAVLIFAAGFPPTVPSRENAGQRQNLQNYKKQFVVAFADPSQAGTLNVDIKRGSIRVSGYDGDEVVVELVVPKYAPVNQQAPSGLTELRPNTLDFDIEKSGQEIKVDGNSYEYTTNLEIKVPRKTHLTLDSYQDGMIQVKDVEGTFNVRSQNNDIRLQNVSGAGRLRSYNGNVAASFAGYADDQPLSIESYNGSIDLTLPAETRANLNYRSERGRVITDFEITLLDESVRTLGNDEVTFEKFVRSKINGGGPEVTIETEKGDIRLLKRMSGSLK